MQFFFYLFRRCNCNEKAECAN